VIYLVDSNVYIRAFRDAAFGQRLRAFHQQHLATLVLSAVVAHELAVGALTPSKERTLLRNLVEPFRVRRRLHVPARQTWELAARLDRRLRRRATLASRLRARSFGNDLLIAASARELGAVILTENSKDFAAISTVVDISYVEPWPDDSIH
jgi:predicted nucleic acid-binding protein